MLLKGSSVTSQDSWIIVHLKGGPYQVGFQNGYLTAQSSDYSILVDVGAPGSDDRETADKVARRYIWPLVPAEYQQELRGIADGMHAAGYPQDTLWDVVAANAWADEACYATLLPGAQAGAARRRAPPPARRRASARQGGCSAFIATGSATADGRPVMGHDTWTDYDGAFVEQRHVLRPPAQGLRLHLPVVRRRDLERRGLVREQRRSAAHRDHAGRLHLHHRRGMPVFVRAREAAQYDATVAQAIHTLVTRNNGAYSNEWLIGDKTGKIASLQLGNKVYDLHADPQRLLRLVATSTGAPRPGPKRSPASPADGPDPYNPAVVDYARYLRWGQLKARYYGKVDAQVGMTMESDTFDTYLNKELPDARDLCGEPEYFTPGLLDWDSWVLDPEGAIDGKVCTEAMALHGLKSWACWGHGSGDHFSAAAYLAANPTWAADNGALAVFGLKTFSAQSTDRWVALKGVRGRCPWR